MLKHYNKSENKVEKKGQRQWFFDAQLNYFANEIMQTLAIEDADEIAQSLNRAFQACITLKIPFNRNFKRVYRFDGKNMMPDYKVSGLACYLIIINCNPSHERVAKAQLYFAIKQAVFK